MVCGVPRRLCPSTPLAPMDSASAFRRSLCSQARCPFPNPLHSQLSSDAQPLRAQHRSLSAWLQRLPRLSRAHPPQGAPEGAGDVGSHQVVSRQPVFVFHVLPSPGWLPSPAPGTGESRHKPSALELLGPSTHSISASWSRQGLQRCSPSLGAWFGLGHWQLSAAPQG